MTNTPHSDEADAPQLVASEDFVNADTDTRYGSSGWQETWTDDIGRLYRDAVREYGRCTGHMFADFSGKSYAVGWVFHGRAEYEDRRSGLRPGRGPSSYLRETWVSLGLRHADGSVYAYDVKRRRPVPLPH